MTSLLDTDVSDLGPRVRQFWRWWLRELATALVPAPRPRRLPDLPVVEVVHREVLRRTTSGIVVLAEAPVRGGVILQLPSDQVLRRSLCVPRLGRIDTERMLELDSDRLTPFPQSTAYHQVVLSRPLAGAPTREVDLVSTPRNVADQALDDARQAGLHVRAVRAWDGPGPGVDLLPLMRGDHSGETPRATRLWLLALTLVATNLGVWVWRDVASTRALEAEAQANRSAFSRAAALVHGTEMLRAHVAALIEDRREREPLQLMDAVTHALPAGVTVDRMQIESDRVRLAGAKPPGLDLAAALQTRPNVRAVHVIGALPPDRFELTLQLSMLHQRALQ